MNPPTIIISLAQACYEAGGKLWIVGGSVRDQLLKLPPKDWDVEIHHLTGNKLQNILNQFGKNKKVGKSFGVWKLDYRGMEIDVSLPTRDDTIDPNMGIEEALARRDLTINAIAYDPLEKRYMDPFNGGTDIHQKMLRLTTQTALRSDPLRAFRAAQFAARFQFTIHPDIYAQSSTLDVAHIAPERIEIEMRKLWLRSPKPSIGLLALARMKLLERVFPQWQTSLDDDYLACLDRGATLRQGSSGWNLALMWAIALHQSTSEQITAIMDFLHIHSLYGYPIRKRILAAHPYQRALFEACNKWQLYQLAEHVELELLGHLSEALQPGTPRKNIIFAQQLGVSTSRLPTIIQGRDLVPLGYTGKQLGVTLEQLRKRQLQGQIHTKEEALQWLLQEK